MTLKTSFFTKRRLLMAFLMFLTVSVLRISGQGLRFHGLETPIAERTSYNVFGQRIPTFNETVNIRFKLQTYMDAERGLIFRMQNKRNPDNVGWIMFYDGATDSHRFYINIENRNTALSLIFKKDTPGKTSEWMDVEFKLSTSKDSIMMKVGDHVVSEAFDFPMTTIQPSITFGKNAYLIDIPSFAIKDLRIGNDFEHYFFPLNEEAGTKVHNNQGKSFGETVNPAWMAGGNHKWNKIFKTDSDGFICAGYDENRHEVLTFDRNSITFYNITTGETRKKQFANECPVQISIGTNFIDSHTGKIYAYEVNYSKHAPGTPTMAVLDTTTLRWTTLSSQQLDMQLHHHGEWFDTLSNNIYVYGGFGDRKYNKNFFRFNIDGRKWEVCPELTGDALWPRYFCAMGHNAFDNHIYIYGGMGNESGQQIVGRQYFYDLYKVDLEDFSVEKKWGIKWEGTHSVAARNMIICEEDSFYALCYPESVTESSMQLYKFSIADGNPVKLGDTIPIFSDKITTNANLFYDPKVDKMIALVEESKDDISSSVTVYSISYPPKEPIQEKSIPEFSISWKTLSIILLLLIGTGSLHNYFKHRRKKKNIALLPYDKHGKRIRPLSETPDSIFLFGDIMMKSSTGEDITPLLTERLKEIFLVVLKYTKEGGISSRRLSAIIWPEKEESKSKNVRGVTLNNLRKIFSQMKGVHLVFDDGKYTIECEEPAFCDYLECLKEINNYVPGNDRLLAILARGKFLREETDVLFDKMKDELDELIVPTVLTEAEWRYQNEDWPNAILCADILFNLDPLNENALAFIVKSLANMGRMDDAKIRYNIFITQYKNDYDEEYPVSLETIIGGGVKTR